MHPNYVWLAVVICTTLSGVVAWICIYNRNRLSGAPYNDLQMLANTFLEWRKEAYAFKIKKLEADHKIIQEQANKMRELRDYNDHLEIK